MRTKIEEELREENKKLREALLDCAKKEWDEDYQLFEETLELLNEIYQRFISGN